MDPTIVNAQGMFMMLDYTNYDLRVNYTLTTLMLVMRCLHPITVNLCGCYKGLGGTYCVPFKLRSAVACLCLLSFLLLWCQDLTRRRRD